MLACYNEWDSEEEDVLMKGLNPQFINKDITHLPKRTRDKIEKVKKLVKE